MSINPDDLFDNAGPIVRTVPVCLDGGRLGALEDARAALTAYEPQDGPPDGRLAGGTTDKGKTELERAVKVAADAVQAVAKPFKLKGLTRKAFNALTDAHPPRDDKPGDKRLGYNVETFEPALLRACLVDPALTEEQFERLLDVLSDAQSNELVETAYVTSRKKVDVPFSLAASVKTPKNAG